MALETLDKTKKFKRLLIIGGMRWPPS